MLHGNKNILEKTVPLKPQKITKNCTTVLFFLLLIVNIIHKKLYHSKTKKIYHRFTVLYLCIIILKINTMKKGHRTQPSKKEHNITYLTENDRCLTRINNNKISTSIFYNRYEENIKIEQIKLTRYPRNIRKYVETINYTEKIYNLIYNIVRADFYKYLRIAFKDIEKSKTNNVFYPQNKKQIYFKLTAPEKIKHYYHLSKTGLITYIFYSSEYLLINKFIELKYNELTNNEIMKELTQTDKYTIISSTQFIEQYETIKKQILLNK